MKEQQTPLSEDALRLLIALRAGVNVAIVAARSTGRTGRLIAAAKPGDAIVTSTEREARRITMLLKEAGTENVIVRAIDPLRLSDLYEFTRRYQFHRLHIDHTFFEEFAARKIDNLFNDIQSITRDFGQ